MGKHELGLRLAGQPFEVYAVPGGNCGGEDGGAGAQARRRVVTDAEAVAVVRAAGVEPEAGVVGLGEDTVRGGEDEVGEEDVGAALVNLLYVSACGCMPHGHVRTRNLHMMLWGVVYVVCFWIVMGRTSGRSQKYGVIVSQESGGVRGH